MRRIFTVLALAAVLFPLCAGEAGAQTQRPPVPDRNEITILARTTITALNHANRTGNYTVFRDLGSPDFQKANTSAGLAEIFGTLRKRDLDLASIVLFNPQFTKPPAIDKRGMLRLTGFFPTKPLAVNFDLAYQSIAGRWRLFGISVSTTPASNPGATPAVPGQ